MVRQTYVIPWNNKIVQSTSGTFVFKGQERIVLPIENKGLGLNEITSRVDEILTSYAILNPFPSDAVQNKQDVNVVRELGAASTSVDTSGPSCVLKQERGSRKILNMNRRGRPHQGHTENTYK